MESGAIQLNDFLKVSASMGLAALVLLSFSIYIRIRSIVKYNGSAAAALIVFIFGAWFNGVLFHLVLSIPFWALLIAGTEHGPFSNEQLKSANSSPSIFTLIELRVELAYKAERRAFFGYIAWWAKRRRALAFRSSGSAIALFAWWSCLSHWLARRRVAVAFISVALLFIIDFL
jgi:hypothetical protein